MSSYLYQGLHQIKPPRGQQSRTHKVQHTWITFFVLVDLGPTIPDSTSLFPRGGSLPPTYWWSPVPDINTPYK
ncbi:hypothetical protein ILYODFUR_021874 [Ilyodon furcidens]|uniref:Uncharacterized protein n=1 Tax=Ilyodon furcidens TaxID=33524 RepID=A0ABV0UV77_9TELE